MGLLISFILTLPLAVTGRAQAVDAGDLFARAQSVPPDATFYLHVEDAAVLRHDIASRPLGRWARRVIDESQFGTAWNNVAGAADKPAWRLFDVFLGDRFTFIMREQGEATEWALITEVHPRAAEWLSRRLKAKVHVARENMVIEEVIEQNLLMARRHDLLVVGPKQESGLFNELLHRLNSPPGTTLASHESVAAARGLGTGVLGLVIRHKAPMGGWSAIVADMEGDDVHIQHRGRFDAAPFQRGLTELTISTGLLDAFENDSLLAIVQPTDLDGGAFDAYLRALGGVPLMAPGQHEALGEQAIVSIGENEGRLNDDPIDLLQPTFALAVALRDDALTVDEVDQMVLGWARATDSALDGAFLQNRFADGRFRPRAPRHIDLQPSEAWFGGLYPIARAVSLNWVVADTPHGAFLVLATHAGHLDDTVASLQAWGGRGGAQHEKLYNAGVANGVRIGHHLRSYAEQAQLFSPTAPEEFRSTLDLLADLAGGLEGAEWTLKRPTLNEMDLEVKVKLSPPDSSGPRPRWP